MTRQQFNTIDQLRLEVETATPTGKLVNLIKNGTGVLGGYGWVTPAAGIVSGVPTPPSVDFSPVGGTATYVITEDYPVKVGDYVSSRWTPLLSGTNYYRTRVEFLDTTGVVIAQTAQTGYLSGGSSTPVTSGPDQVPTGTATARLRFDVYGNTSGGVPTGAKLRLGNVQMVSRTASGAVTWTDVADAYTTQILTSATSLTITRSGLDPASLSVVVPDSTLDPAVTATLRPGRAVRVYTTPTATYPTGRPLFTGKLTAVDVTYDAARTDTKAARIELTAVDSISVLANTPRPNGVASVDGLKGVLEGCRIPWNINGNTAQGTPPTVISRNDNASALDQVILTRDSNRAVAWMSGGGVLNVFSIAAVSGPTVSESVYSDLQVGLSPCTNTVTVVWLRYNPSTGQTDEITYGPYVNQASIDQWGAQAATYTVQGVDEAAFDIPGYAAAVLAANSTRTVRATGLTIPIRTAADVAAWAPVDLYSFATVVNTNKGLNQGSLVTAITHTITPTKWLVTLGLDDPTQVASPLQTPSPSDGGQQVTFTQLIRPVGEVTMWFGAKAAIPTGWLALDGSTFTATDYPALNTLLGTNTLPNMTDRFPIGAGSKALGNTGGSVTHAHTAPAHAHTISSATVDGTTAANTTTGGTATRVTAITGGVHAHGGATGSAGGTATTSTDSTPPYLALWFIIRAK